MPKVTIAQNILAANETIAQEIRQALTAHGLRTINIMSSPGAGKTTLLERTIERLRGQLSIGVIEGDIETTADAERIEAARQHLAQRFAERHQLRSVARTVGMSTFQFARMFRELVGSAPHQYLLRIRYRAALHMLLEGASVTDACFECGFSNLSHFSRQFRQRFGLCPSSVKTWPRHWLERRVTRAQSTIWPRK